MTQPRTDPVIALRERLTAVVNTHHSRRPRWTDQDILNLSLLLRDAEDDEDEATWAHVVSHPEDHAPALLSDEDLEDVQEVMHDLTSGYFLDRKWIRPGPLLDGAAEGRRHDPEDHDCRGGVVGDKYPLGQPVAEDRE